MNDPVEYLYALSPLTVRRRVLWGECDPAGVVYTPRFAEYTASARDYWFRHVLGHLDRPHPSRQQVVFPMRAMNFDFRGMIAPDETFDMVVTLGEVRTRSFTLAITATHERGHSVFNAGLTQVAFDQAAGAAVAIPAHLAQRLTELAQPVPNGLRG